MSEARLSGRTHDEVRPCENGEDQGQPGNGQMVGKAVASGNAASATNNVMIGKNRAVM